MKQIKSKTWITWALILFGLGLFTDYVFLHLFFREGPKDTSQIRQQIESALVSPGTSHPQNTELGEQLHQEANTFLENLQKCAPEIAAQAVATPEALIEYLRKSVGIEKEDIPLENYHLTLPNGSQRRLQVLVADNTNSTNKKELRYFQIDSEGYPERLNIQADDTLESLLSQGTLTKHEVKSVLQLKDGSFLNLEMHNKTVFEFQFNNHGKVLSCRYSDCQCP